MHRAIYLGLGAVLVSLLGGCSDEDPTAVTGCPEEDKVGDVCAGVPAAPVCDSDTCTAGVSCATTVPVDGDAALASAIAGASAAACITLAPGSYGAVTLPGGVSLLGRAAADVTVAGVKLAAGQGATIRGLSIGQGGLEIDGATGVRIESVRVSGSAIAGVTAAAGSSGTIVTSTIAGSARHGITLADGADIHVESTIVEGSQGPGIWAACSGDCDACSAPPQLSVQSSIVRDNHIGGIALFGTTATFNGVYILRTKPGGPVWHHYEGGGGLSVASCSTLTATALRVQDSAKFGVFIDNSGADIGTEAMPGFDVDISRNVVGFWVQHTLRPVSLNAAMVEGNVGVSIGVGPGVGDPDAAPGERVGIVICRSAIQNTAMAQLPVLDAFGDPSGQGEVGDGLTWLNVSKDGFGPSTVTMQGVEFSGNARVSMLIDGATQGGSIKNVTLGSGEKPPVLQNSPPGGDQPAVENAPPLTPQQGTALKPSAAPAVPSSSLE